MLQIGSSDLSGLQEFNAKFQHLKQTKRVLTDQKLLLPMVSLH